MSSTAPIILILGSGANVGQHVAKAFGAKGYRVALASRSAKEEESTENQIHVSSDLSDPNSVVEVFSKVKSRLGTPSVVIYNAASATGTAANSPLALPLDTFSRDLAINTTSAFVAAQQAASGFEQLPESASKTFIYTGNILNTTILPPLLSLGVGKSATAHIIRSAAAAYADRGFKFYYADERKADGSPAYSDISGPGHGAFYAELADGKTQQQWQQTFVSGLGYKQF